MTDHNSKRIYTQHDAMVVNFLLRKTIHKNVELIGELQKNKTSEEGIFLLIYKSKRETKLTNKLSKILEPKDGYIYIEPESIHFRKTFFGEVKIFFTNVNNR